MYGCDCCGECCCGCGGGCACCAGDACALGIPGVRGLAPCGGAPGVKYLDISSTGDPAPKSHIIEPFGGALGSSLIFPFALLSLLFFLFFFFVLFLLKKK